MRKLALLSVLVVAAVALAFRPAPVSLDTAIQGAWQAVEFTNNDGETNAITNMSLTLFTEGHYASMRIGGEGDRALLPEEPTDEQRLDALGRFFGNGGIYEIDGDELVTKVMIHRNPNSMAEGITRRSGFEVDGNTLIRTFTNPEGNTFVVKYNKLVAGGAIIQ